MAPWKAGVEEHEFANDEDVGTNTTRFSVKCNAEKV
jgi:hypothetical protein